MKIWVIGRSYPAPENNMTGSFELEQAKMLYKNGEKVCYLCCSLHPNKVIGTMGYHTWVDEGIIICSYSKKFFPRVFPLYFPKWRNYLWSEFFKQVYEENGMPDVIHVHYPAMLMIADALCQFHKMGVKIVMTEHWTKVLSKDLDSIETKEYRKYFSYIDACICVGVPLANSVKKLINHTGIPIYVVPNVVDQEFRPLYKQHKGFEFIAIGRLVKIKQFDLIIKAFSEVFRGCSVKLTIVGDGIEYDALEKLISNLLMKEQIMLTGSLTRRQVAEKIANADCLICYSRFETFGVPIIEAWACGIPTITTTAAAVIDNFDKRLGVEVLFDDIEDLKAKIKYMYENIECFNKKFISDFAQKNFSESAIYRRLKKIYLTESI